MKKLSLDELVTEAKQSYAPREDLDWDALEARLEKRLAVEEVAPRVESLRASGSIARVAAFGLAAAAAAVLVLGREREGGPLGAVTVGGAETTSAGTLRATEGSDVRVGGVLAETGLGLRTGDVVEVNGGRAVFERPRKVMWLLEGESGQAGHARVRVAATNEPVVLSLEEGAVEAQVTRSDLPETFAVDVTSGGRTVRIAVHGTHLRVARAGGHVVVDLSEGVVSIGVPPRTGPTYGTLVTAPAHVELDVGALEAMRVDHARASVRAPNALGPGERETTAAREAAPSLRPASSPPGALAPPAQASAVADAPHARTEGPATTPPRPASAADVANAVRECVASARKARPEVKVTVATTLHLRISDAGEVLSAVFDPPLAPEVQTCAAGKIYGTKVEGTGTVDVPITLSY